MIAIKGAIHHSRITNWGMRMLFALLLIVLTATSGEGTHTTVRGRGTY